MKGGSGDWLIGWRKGSSKQRILTAISAPPQRILGSIPISAGCSYGALRSPSSAPVQVVDLKCESATLHSYHSRRSSRCGLGRLDSLGALHCARIRLAVMLGQGHMGNVGLYLFKVLHEAGESCFFSCIHPLRDSRGE